MGGSPWSLRCRNCLEQRPNNNVKYCPKCIYFSDLFWLISKFDDRRSKRGILFGKSGSRPGPNFFWMSVKSNNIINSSYINHVYPLGNLLFRDLSVIGKFTQPNYSIYFSMITNQMQFVTPWFVMHSDWLRRCWQGTSWVCTWASLRTRTPHLLCSLLHCTGRCWVFQTSLEGLISLGSPSMGRLDFTGLVVVSTVDSHSGSCTDLLAWNYHQDLGKQNWLSSTS